MTDFPLASSLLMALGGLLIGGAYSFWKQDFPRWVSIGFGVCAVLSLVAAWAVAQ
ncbi:hypothetical protein [Micrococcoides hystricis]|uniref:Uncharacterized protein n=1 Tax=Micrococcoides hystricis TaxID=1572761 RepID=A0ABV6P8K0_9MICC